MPHSAFTGTFSNFAQRGCEHHQCGSHRAGHRTSKCIERTFAHKPFKGLSYRLIEFDAFFRKAVQLAALVDTLQIGLCGSPIPSLSPIAWGHGIIAFFGRFVKNAISPLGSALHHDTLCQ